MKKIIINADDYGLSPKFNQGIVELIEKGIVSSTTVMVNQKYVEPTELKKYQNISIGLHLELGDEPDEKVIEEQYQKFLNLFNQPPSHFDGHQHCHNNNGWLETVIQISKKYNLPVRSNNKEAREQLKQAGIETPDKYLSWHPKRKKKFFKKIKDIIQPITEIVCHPGYFDPDCDYPYNKRREDELKILQSEDFKQAIKPYQIINYFEIQHD